MAAGNVPQRAHTAFNDLFSTSCAVNCSQECLNAMQLAEDSLTKREKRERSISTIAGTITITTLFLALLQVKLESTPAEQVTIFTSDEPSSTTK